MARMKKIKRPAIPKTVTVFGRKLKVERTHFATNDWVIRLGPGLPVIWIIGGDVFHVSWNGCRGHAEDFRKAIQCIEPQMVDYFKRLGKVLGYDVED